MAQMESGSVDQQIRQNNYDALGCFLAFDFSSKPSNFEGERLDSDRPAHFFHKASRRLASASDFAR